MSQETPKSNVVLIVAILGVLGTIVASVIGAVSNYNIEELRQSSEMTKIALVSIATEGGSTQQVMAQTINAPVTQPPTYTPLPTYTPQATYTPQPTFTSIPTPDALFRDDFSDNRNGWDISGFASIANGELSITAKPQQEIWFTLPNFKINSENYYIQAKMAMTTKFCGCYAGFGLGLGLGEKDVSYHKFYFTNWVNGFNFRQYGVNFFDNGEKLYSEATTDKIWLWSEYHTIRIEVKSGQVTLYHDGVPTITKQITPHGNDLGFYVVNYENGDLTFSFDDVVVKEIP